MARPIENTLAILQDVMAAHRDALAREPQARPPFRFAAQQDRRHELVLRLLAGVEQRAGIDVSQPTAEKLLRLLAPISLGEIEADVARLESLPPDDPDWQALIESLTVHETYIMRDPSQFALFATLLPEMIAQAAARSHLLRFWSVGCASGEEAYSIAALALDALAKAGKAEATDKGISLRSPWRLEVAGADISRRALTRAEAGVYETGPLSSFRAEAAALLHHFPPLGTADESAPARRAAAPWLKRVVRFSQFNIIDGALPAEPFDAVFCRNVFIYFSERARRHAQERLARTLRPGGLLLLGPTDTLSDAGAFETLWGPDAVAYRRRGRDV
ncbi:MAG: CheR family methyltransferase [Pseudomonadota bacterium]